MAELFRGGSIRHNLAHLLAMSYGMSGAVEMADDLLERSGANAEIARLRGALEDIADTTTDHVTYKDARRAIEEHHG